MLAKKHELEYQTILAICDKEHLNKTYEEGNISFTVSEKFFGGTKVSEKKLKELFKNSNSINLFGNKCVEIAQKEGLITESSVIKIQGIKHAQIYGIQQ
ncbi:MAG: DUF424 family protein [Candidatus Diapherotrites archaeon]|jgi:hypothetical protein|uniref:DUF424 family protein n=1 Tax=Candidatus Iainarchaeum sp. TaxID=3101447 RepID=A0A7K4BZW6_9ARCH|nr:DUF424 family protein [Candidatus Diapherotrites archaeon]